MPTVDFSKWVKPSDIAEAVFFLVGDKGSLLREPIFKVYGDS
jgi:hypothetical protein